MGVVVLHGADGPAVRMTMCPAAGPVAGVQVGHQHLGPDPGEELKVAFDPRQGVDRGKVVHVTDVLAHPGVPAFRQRARVLQVRTDRERRVHLEGQGNGKGRVASGTADRELCGVDHPRH